MEKPIHLECLSKIFTRKEPQKQKRERSEWRKQKEGKRAHKTRSQSKLIFGNRKECKTTMDKHFYILSYKILNKGKVAFKRKQIKIFN